MPRYIDADLLLNELQEELEFDTPFYTEKQNKYVNRGLSIAIRDIKRTPTADVREVVQCKDCKHYYKGIMNRCTHLCGLKQVGEFDWCCWGERRDV